MLDFALTQIYSRVFRVVCSLALDNAWVGDSRLFIYFSFACLRPCRDVPHSRFRCKHLKLYLLDFLNMLDFALSQMYTSVFYLRKSIDLDSVWVRDSRLCQLSFLS